MRYYFARFGLLLTVSLVCLLALEGVARLLVPMPAFKTNLPLYPYRSQMREVVLPNVSSPSQFSTNRWGMRGTDPPKNWDESYTLITIGGSTTRDYYLDDTKTWSAVLEQHLTSAMPAVWVGNAGLDGHSTRGHLVLMQDVIQTVRPDAIILLVGINDLTISFSEEEIATYDNQRASFLTQSQVFNLLWSFKQIALDGVYVVDSAGGYTTFVPQTITDPSILTPLPADLRELLPSLPRYRENLLEIIRLAREWDIDLLFLTQPALFQNTPEWELIWGKGYWVENQSLAISAATWAAMLDIFNQELLAICAEEHVPCYDLATDLGHDPRYFYDFVHFSEVGSDRIGELVAEAVLDQLAP